MDDLQKRAWAEISLENIEHNYKAMRAKLPEGCRFLAVMKADAYGHGVYEIAPLLEKLGADYFAVAEIEEAKTLRKMGLKTPILILGYTGAESTAELIQDNVTQTVNSLDIAKEFSRRAQKAGGVLKAHLKLDSGMGRLGFTCHDGEAEANMAEIEEALSLPAMDYEGVFTHFAVSDVDGGEEYTEKQYRDFLKTVDEIEKRTGHKFRIRHCANSGAMISHSGTYLDMVRPGLALYGLYPGSDRGDIELRPAMELKARIAQIKEFGAGYSVSYGRIYTTDSPRRIAVITIGYADGLHRVLSNKMEVLVRGKRAPQVGRICMDMCMIDVTDIPEARVGDAVTVFGRDGDGYISPEEQAEKAGTVSYELLCAVSKRVPRFYK